MGEIGTPGQPRGPTQPHLKKIFSMQFMKGAEFCHLFVSWVWRLILGTQPFGEVQTNRPDPHPGPSWQSLWLVLQTSAFMIRLPLHRCPSRSSSPTPPSNTHLPEFLRRWVVGASYSILFHWEATSSALTSAPPRPPAPCPTNPSVWTVFWDLF